MSKRTMITLRPEWEQDLQTLKKEVYYDKSKAAMFRALIADGLKIAKEGTRNEAKA